MIDRRTARLARSAAGRRYLERKATEENPAPATADGSPEHGTDCPRPLDGLCLQFSMDGTRLGAYIAHQMGTTSEEAIIYNGIQEDWQMRQDALTGMDAEQADWEADMPD